jgi:alpha-galactosidase
MPKITLIGAGSTVFARNLIGDILGFPELAASTISLLDIDERRLKTSEIVARKLASSLEVSPVIEATLDRKEALAGADYVIAMFQVAGYEPGTVLDFEIPKKYGLRQTIADTLGIGGIMRGLRTIPVLLDVCQDIEELCPDALLLNYVNPMAMNTWAISRGSSVKNVGLCHSVLHTAHELAVDIGVPVDEITYIAAGINHMAFFLKFERNSEDLYPLIRAVIQEGRVPPWNRVRYEMFKKLGYFVTESSEHFSEYVPWFIKSDRPDLLERFNIPLDEYLQRCELQITAWDLMGKAYETGVVPPEEAISNVLDKFRVTPAVIDSVWQQVQQINQVKHSGEYGSLIIHSIETGRPRVIYGNVQNTNLIENLPLESCVEVPCLVDANGVQPVHIGKIPVHLAALMQTNINVQALTVEAALTHNREHIYHAAMLDPHTAAELDLDQIWSMVDELIAAHGDWLPNYT